MNEKLLINCNEIIKEMKPLHGVCNGPLHKGNAIDESIFFRQLQPPFVRLHDVNWPYSREVDMHAVFPDFSKDPEDPDSYDFSMTDKYLKAIKDVGSDIIYRLGESIAPADYKRFVNPPTDMEKWARICIGIIRHYNNGWADGFHYDIKYWEIWNEPSVETMWTGTLEQYLEMYSAAAKAIRSYDSSLKICGPVACSADRITNEVFLKYINSHLEVPHDVYTFHLYGHSVENTKKYLSILNEAFEKYNKRDFDVFITEWNYAPQTEDGEGFWETLAATKDIMVKSKLFRKIGSLEA
ncbi:MAG: cellulase family glycosylhydrolase, partial [Clostridia bacterium]|nr:cellulase family glycosylhydrolase [Clostridia bacterium]